MNWLGYLDYPQGKGSLLFVVLHCSSSKPVYGRLTSEQSPVLQIRPRLWLWLCLCCIFSLCSHRPFFSRRQSPSTTTMVSLSLTSSTPPMPSPSSSPSFHHSTMQLQPSESGEHRAAQVLGIANSPMHSSIHVSLHGLTIIKPLHSSPTIVLSPILFESNISSQTKSQIAEQLHGPNMPCLDFSTG